MKLFLKEFPLKNLNTFSGMLFTAILFFTGQTFGEIKKDTLSYKDNKSILEGQLVYDSTQTAPKPAVIIIHQWMGPTEHEYTQAQKLADMGYVAFVADIYGKDVRPKDTNEAGKLATTYKSDVPLFRKRIKAAIDIVAKDKKVDAKKIVVIGYCFGGTGALEAARAGFPIVGAVSFHGGLSTPKPQETKNIKAKLLVLHGAIDPYVPAKDVDGFMKEMNDAKADYQFVSYSGAVHAFTQKGAGDDITKGAAYNEPADRRSWLALKNFLSELVK